MKTQRREQNSALKKIVCFLILSLSFEFCFLKRAHSAFEDVGTGARAVALGGAYTALGNDTWSLMYNPAGLARLEHLEIISEYSQLFSRLTDGSDLSQYFMGAGIPMKSFGTIALGCKEFGLKDLYSEKTYSLGYGKKIGSHLSVGGALKYLRHSFNVSTTAVDDNGAVQAGVPSLFSQKGNARGNMSSDIGFLYRLSDRQLVGFSVRDLNQPNMALDNNDSDRVTRTWHVGWARDNVQWLSLTADLSARQSSSQSLDTTAMGGLEKEWGTAVTGDFALRGAMALGSREFRQCSMGFGYRWKSFNLDYAFVFNVSGLSIGSTAGTHRFSLAYRFGVKNIKLLQLEVVKKPVYEEGQEDLSYSVLKGPEDPSIGLNIEPAQRIEN